MRTDTKVLARVHVDLEREFFELLCDGNNAVVDGTRCAGHANTNYAIEAVYLRRELARDVVAVRREVELLALRGSMSASYQEDRVET